MEANEFRSDRASETMPQTPAGQPVDKLEKILEETNQIQFHLSQQKNMVDETIREFINYHKRLEEIGREIPDMVKNISQVTDKNKINAIIRSLDESISNKEERLNELKAQMSLLQPKLRQKINAIEKISQETLEETERSKALANKLQSLRKSLPEYETVYKEVLEEVNSLEERARSKIVEKQKILETIKNLQSDQIPKEEAKLRDLKAQMESAQPQLRQRQDTLTKINEEISVVNKKLEETQMELQTLTNRYQEQISIQDGLPKESVSLDTILLGKQQEKQRILDKINSLESIAIPQENERIKEAREKIKQLQTEINQKQGPLNKLTTEIPMELQKLKELEKKEDYLKKEYQAAEINRRELASHLSQIEDLIEKKKQERSKIDQWSSQIEAGTNQYTELLDKTKETTKILLDETHRRREIYGDVIPTIVPLAKNQTVQPRPNLKAAAKTGDSTQIFKAIFLVCILIGMLAALGLFIWQIIKMAM